MSASDFIKRQLLHLREGGTTALFRKAKRALKILFRSPLFVAAIPMVLVMRLIRPLLLVRLGPLISSRIGHFAANTELYLCERDAGINVPEQRHMDILYAAYRPICNRQLVAMWARIIRIWPAWIVDPVFRVNRMIPGGSAHETGMTAQNDRDIHNLLDRFPPHLEFTAEEELAGESGLQAMGIPKGAPFVCLIVRDSAYLGAHLGDGDYSYHNYRDSDIQNYVLAAEELASRGYYVIRMGARVHGAIKSRHPMVIDYATNGMRNDFMDIYLGAKCKFCISVGTGFDAIPLVFRRPILYVNIVPLGYLFTFRSCFIGITKHHFLREENREMTLREIFATGAGFGVQTSDYESRGIRLMENSPEEIRDVAVEMAERLDGTWQTENDDGALQQRFWEIFPAGAKDAAGRAPLHGDIRGRFGANFLRSHRSWLQ